MLQLKSEAQDGAMLPETRIHFQHRIVKTQFSFCRGAAQFNQSAAANSRRAFRLRVAGDLEVAPALHRRSPAAVAELGRWAAFAMRYSGLMLALFCLAGP